jgi:hypothetical protein
LELHFSTNCFVKLVFTSCHHTKSTGRINEALQTPTQKRELIFMCGACFAHGEEREDSGPW